MLEKGHPDEHNNDHAPVSVAFTLLLLPYDSLVY